MEDHELDTFKSIFYVQKWTLVQHHSPSTLNRWLTRSPVVSISKLQESVEHGVSKREHAIGKMRGLSMDVNGQHSSLFICSIIPIYKRDFLGIFTDNIRFSEDLSTTYSIPGPIKPL